MTHDIYGKQHVAASFRKLKSIELEPPGREYSKHMPVPDFQSMMLPVLKAPADGKNTFQEGGFRFL